MVGFVSSGYDLHPKTHDHSLSFIFQVYRFFKFLVDVGFLCQERGDVICDSYFFIYLSALFKF